MDAYFTSLEFWHWLALGLLFLIGEILASGFFLIWLGLGAIVVGLLMLIVPDISWQLQLIIFSVLSFSCLFLWRRFGGNAVEEDHTTLNVRGAQYVGRIYTLDDAIVNGAGWCKVGDGRWSVRGPDLAAGTRVRVVRAESNVLVVEAAD